MCPPCIVGTVLLFFFNDTATTEIYTLSLHDALPISRVVRRCHRVQARGRVRPRRRPVHLRRDPHAALCGARDRARSEEHTSELQSRQYLVCRLLLEKKKNTRSMPFCRSLDTLLILVL